MTNERQARYLVVDNPQQFKDIIRIKNVKCLTVRSYNQARHYGRVQGKKSIENVKRFCDRNGIKYTISGDIK